MNIVLWTCHDMGVACNPYGDDSIATPNLSRLADSGATFTRNFCTTPLCSPSRGSIQTGRYPHVSGLIGLVNLGWDLPHDQRCLVNHLAHAGYRTALCGFQHIRAEVESLGFDQVLGRETSSARRAGAAVAELLEAADGPLYIEVNTAEAHRPWADDDGSVDPAQVNVPPYWPDNDEVREDLAGVYRHIRAIDDGVGTVLDALDRGVGGETLFVFTVDHGIAFPRCKSTLYDSGLRTALMMRLDGRIPPGLRSDTLISNVDLCPTVLDLAGARAPAGLDGRSFAKHALNTASSPHRQWVFATKSWHDDYDPMRCVRTERWKYIRNLRPGPLLTLAADMQPARCGTARAMANGYLAPRPDEELYDLHEDPHELNNLASEAVYRSTLDELRAMLDDWMEKTGDPFLEHGYVPAPARNWLASQRGRQWWADAEAGARPAR